MSERCDYGPLRTYEITWKTGHVERVQGHQVMFGSSRLDTASLFGDMLGGVATTRASLPPRFTIHGQVDGRWRLVLTAPEADLISIRDVTQSETVPEGEVAS